MNVGRAIGGFSSVVIGLLMDHYSLGVTMGFLSALYSQLHRYVFIAGNAETR